MKSEFKQYFTTDLEDQSLISAALGNYGKIDFPERIDKLCKSLAGMLGSYKSLISYLRMDVYLVSRVESFFLNESNQAKEILKECGYENH